MNWKQLLIKKTIVGRIPYAEGLRKFKRRLFGYPPDPDNLEMTINSYDSIIKMLAKLGLTVQDSVILEIGSGWFPTIPILLARDGAKKIIMSDLNVHMDKVTYQETVTFLKKYFPNDTYIQNISGLDSMPIEYFAPLHISELKSESLDFIISRTVLEHIPKSDIYALFTALRPKIKSKGHMVHVVDHSDHFEHHDKSISKINFLTWNDEKHALINYLIKDGENRLRHQEYHQIFTDAGYELLEEEIHIDEKTLETAKKLEVVYPYSTMKPEQLAAVGSIYYLQKA